MIAHSQADAAMVRYDDLLAAGEQQYHSAHRRRLRAEGPPQPGRANRRRFLCHGRTFSEVRVYSTRPCGHRYVSTYSPTG